MIELQNVDKKFRDIHAADQISAKIQDGMIFGLVGSNGAGKSTLLRMVSGIIKPDSGEILGMEGQKLSAVFQEDRLCENTTPVSNIRLVNPSLSKEEAQGMLRDLGLEGSLGQPVRTLSGGMKRRVAILRALAADYDVLLCDEPFKGLDQATKALVMDYFLGKTKGKTVILVTHDQGETEALGGHFLLL